MNSIYTHINTNALQSREWKMNFEKNVCVCVCVFEREKERDISENVFVLRSFWETQRV